ncbi:MAG: 4-alpha-glucanotransferase, partial [Bacteroidota bacterium]
MKLQFYLRFHTDFGQSLWITGDTEELGNNQPSRAMAMEYLNEEFWQASIEIKRKELQKNIFYRYILKNIDGDILYEWGNDRKIDVFRKDLQEVQLADTWNHAGEYENVFFSDAFNKVLLRPNQTRSKAGSDKNFTHVFKVKAPLLHKNEVVCLLGQGEKLADWSEAIPVLMKKEEDWWIVKPDLSSYSFPVSYKYGVYNTKEKKFVCYEGGNNRLLYSDGSKRKISILHDGFVHLPNSNWKGSGVAIPVFSLRSRNSFGVGEFTDIKPLVDWSKAAGLKLIQLLPINDTMANFNWMDSYPYSAVSAFALHPLYINLWKVAGKEYADQLASLKLKQKELNDLPVMDYEEVMKYK